MGYVAFIFLALLFRWAQKGTPEWLLRAWNTAKAFFLKGSYWDTGLPEPDPLKELDEAHKIELAEWDREFETVSTTPVRYLLDPGLAERERYLSQQQQNIYSGLFVAGLRQDFGAAAAQAGMRQASLEEEQARLQAAMNQQQGLVGLQQKLNQLGMSGQLGRRFPWQ